MDRKLLKKWEWLLNKTKNERNSKLTSAAKRRLKKNFLAAQARKSSHLDEERRLRVSKYLENQKNGIEEEG